MPVTENRICKCQVSGEMPFPLLRFGFAGSGNAYVRAALLPGQHANSRIPPIFIPAGNEPGGILACTFGDCRGGVDLSANTKNVFHIPY